MENGKAKIAGLKAPKSNLAKGSPQQAITANTLAKSSVAMMAGGQNGKKLKAKGK